MKLLLHDLTNEDFKKIVPKPSKNITTISSTSEIRKCIGCFNCWIKTPGKCILNDNYANIGELIAKSDELIIVSKCYYGSYSPFIKNLIDRSISFILPYFRIINNEMHHVPRYEKKFKLSLYSYGECTDLEKETLKALLARNAINLNVDDYNFHYCDNIYTNKELKEALI